MPERHLSARAVFDPSWERLTEGQRELFASLAVFRGGFTREAAETVAGASLQDLAALVNKSLLRRDLSVGRYEVHELLRQYAREHLQAVPATNDAVAEAHAVYFADLIQKLWLMLISGEQQKALAMIGADIENLRQSWRFWLNRRNAVRIRMYIDVFRRVYDLRGWYKTGMELFREAVSVLRSTLDTADEEAQVAYAEVLAGQAYFMAHLGYADAGLKQAQESVAVLSRHRRFNEMIIPCDIMQYNEYYIEEREQVTHWDLRQETEFTNDADGLWRWAYHTAWQGRQAAWHGRYDEGRQQVGESLQAFEQLGDARHGWPRFELGNMAVLQGDFSEAQNQYSTIRKIAQAGDFDWPNVKATRYLGNIAFILESMRKQDIIYLASLLLADELGMIRDIISALYDVATVEAAAGNEKTAVRWLADGPAAPAESPCEDLLFILRRSRGAFSRAGHIPPGTAARAYYARRLCSGAGRRPCYRARYGRAGTAGGVTPTNTSAPCWANIQPGKIQFLPKNFAQELRLAGQEGATLLGLKWRENEPGLLPQTNGR